MLALLQIIWGEGFLSPGGAEEIERLLEGSDITGCEVLDIGCGLGACDEILVSRYRVKSVVGIDIDPALLEIMQERIGRARLADRIKRPQSGSRSAALRAASFDLVFSKDSMVQIPDKPAMFAEILRVLKPGGRFIASDWLRGGTGPYSSQMMEYFRARGHRLQHGHARRERGGAAQAGFVEVEIRDRNAWYLDLARRELDAMEGVMNGPSSRASATMRTAFHRQLAPARARARARRTASRSSQGGQAARSRLDDPPSDGVAPRCLRRTRYAWGATRQKKAPCGSRH